MSRSKAYRRYQRRTHINRKKHVIKSQNDYWHYQHDGELDKGKIHCSCPMCRHKSRDMASFSNQRKLISAIDELLEFGSAGAREVGRIMHRTRLGSR